MKKLVIACVCLLLLAVAGCFGDEETDTSVSGLNIVTRDGCEYIKNITLYGYVYTHKGNCTNSIHIYNKVTK